MNKWIFSKGEKADFIYPGYDRDTRNTEDTGNSSGTQRESSENPGDTMKKQRIPSIQLVSKVKKIFFCIKGTMEIQGIQWM